MNYSATPAADDLRFPLLQDKVVVVTGAAQGLGHATALYLAERGASVVAVDLKEVLETVAMIRAVGAPALGLQADVSNPEETRQALVSVVERFGRIDALVNCAALFTTLTHKSFFDISADEWDRVFAVNTKSVFLCSQAAGEQMVAQGFGSIVNIGSNVVSYGMADFLHYVASKAAIVGITRSLARELGPHNVRVNTASPGLIATETVEEQRSEEYRKTIISNQCMVEPIMPRDVAATVAFLCSDESRLITGQTILVNGGSHMGPA